MHEKDVNAQKWREMKWIFMLSIFWLNTKWYLCTWYTVAATVDATAVVATAIILDPIGSEQSFSANNAHGHRTTAMLRPIAIGLGEFRKKNE